MRRKTLQRVLSVMFLSILVFSAMIDAFLPVLALPVIGTNANVSNSASYAQNEPHIAVNPLNHNKLVVGYNDNHFAPSGGWGLSWSWSDDGGSTWNF